jgi:inosose dehydratase
MGIRVANAPVSWGIYEFKDIEPKFPYARVLDEIAGAGYTGIELGPWGYLPTDPGRLRAELAHRGLVLLSSFVPVRLVDPKAHEAAAAEALKVGRLLANLGAVYVVLADDNGTVPELVREAGRRKGSRLSGREWDVVARGVNMIARRVNDETGLGLVFHHHCGGYVETPQETRELLSRTDESLVGLCLDTGHWHYGGGDAVDCIEQYGRRVRYLHLKDCHPGIAAECRAGKLDYFDAVKSGVFCVLGKGEVDFPGIKAAMEGLGYDGWAVVEQDVLVDDLEAPRRYAKESRDYLKSIGL